MMRIPQPPDSILAVLPVDLLVQILDRLPDSGDRKSFRLVSCGFLRAEALHRRALRVLRRESLPSVLCRYSALESLDLSPCPALDDAALATALHTTGGLQTLKTVCLARATGIGWRGLEALVAACPRLEMVDLSHCVGVGDREAAALAATGWLREVRLDKCLGITDVGLAKLAVGCPGIERLGIKWCLEISDLGIDLLSKKCRDLKVLDISYLKSIDVSRCCNVSTLGLVSVIEGHKRLQKINAGDCFPELVPLFLSRLSVIRGTLKVLKVEGFHVLATSLRIIGTHCKNLEEIGLDDALIAIADHCKRLECLLLESCSQITEKGLDWIGTCCSGLKEVDLTDCPINDTALKCLSRCSELRTLKLGLCPNISVKGLLHIGSNCRKLLELDLYRCTGVTDGGLAAIAAGCKNLKKLNVCYCMQITDEGLKHLSCLKELLDLEMRRLVNVTSAGMAAIAFGCRSLVELDIKRCYSVDDAGLWALAQYSNNLRQINISYCPVTGVGLCKLLGTLRCLQDAKLVHLTRVSIEGYEFALRASWDRLKKLKLLGGLRHFLTPGLLQMLKARGCRIRWVDKPLLFGGSTSIPKVDQSPTFKNLEIVVATEDTAECGDNVVQEFSLGGPEYGMVQKRNEKTLEESELGNLNELREEMKEFSFGGVEFTKIQYKNKKILEESGLDRDNDEEEKDDGEEQEEDLSPKELEFSFRAVGSDTIRNQTKQTLEESKLSHDKEEKEEEEINNDMEAPSSESQEEETESSSAEEESERQDEGSDGTGASSKGSSFEAVWPAEQAIEQEDSSLLEKHQEVTEESSKEEVTAAQAEEEIEEYGEEFTEEKRDVEEQLGNEMGTRPKMMKSESERGLMAVNYSNSSNESSSNSEYEASNRSRKHKHGERSKKIMLKLEKTKEDKLAESNRNELLKFLNASYD
ncbi:putative F-box/LRR-repeat protein 3 [Cocos nucifera]|uniref:Putative F-box/LRR-repeat protein 3 n=1 Tax=Cocos nucifera TaxID=13894 RepID=A0A8K0HU96_COCNU|nr:putative F-box/LRR-repeat protein 3 [Cocos nucifera]